MHGRPEARAQPEHRLPINLIPYDNAAIIGGKQPRPDGWNTAWN